jgi:hypothetical protein
MKLFPKNVAIKNYSESDSMLSKKDKIIDNPNISKNLKIIVIIILIILFVILIIIHFRNYSNNWIYDYKDENIIIDNETVHLDEKFESYKVAFEKNIDFINDNLDGLLLNITKKEFPQNIKVSIVIPCYNCENYILSCVRSIQNQDFSNFEIIIVNDGSTDDCLDQLEELQEKDERIEIISNKMKMGILYSRSIGALSSKGKYIFTMDGDDMYLSKDVLFSITKIALRSNIDIIIFNSIYSSLKPDVYTTKIFLSHYEKKYKPNRILYQPYLGYYAISPSNNIEKPSFNEILMHPKCIKTKVYQNALERFGEERYPKR